MLSYIYIPFDAFERPSWLKRTGYYLDKPCQIIGYHLSNCYIVVDFFTCVEKLDLHSLDPALTILGSVNTQDWPDTHSGRLYLRFDSKSKFPYVDHKFYSSLEKFVIVFFKPPNLRNLEYFAVHPILLESGDMAHKPETYAHNLLKVHSEQGGASQYSICNESILEKINTCSRIRSKLRVNALKPEAHTTIWPLLTHLAQNLSSLRAKLKSLVIWTMGILISTSVWLISLLNTRVCGFNPVEVSAWCRQLDLRLRQISYFPFQFLSYYDTELLNLSVRSQLDIPFSNEAHNIHNSDYINLYNTIWMMVNDIIIGRTIYSIISKDLGKILRGANDRVIATCFTKLDSFIAWIGSDYPGGFKLNNDLGQFMELLFLWTSQSSRAVFIFLVRSHVASHDTWFIFVFKFCFKFSCYLGATFLTAFVIDYAKIVNLHAQVFCIAATKIYFRQVEMLKSLMQLFRGRKYNVLRNRIDKIEEDQLRIDQLLMGTFVFLVLIYLLPTVFAFYFLFYAYRVAMRTCLKLGDKLILCLNLYPIFVILLKLKNSRRLQGGVYFTYKGCHEATDWFIMENKALTFDEICGNFYHVFRQEGRFERLFLNFVEGIDLQVKDTSSMKYEYLMLPQNHDSLPKIWLEATSANDRG